MTPDLIKYIQKAQQITLHDGSELKDIFFKDAIYKAAGLSAFNLFDEVNFACSFWSFVHFFSIWG